MTRKKKLKKPSELLSLYGQRLSQTLEKRLSPTSFEITFSFRSPKTASLSGFVVFRSGWILEFDEIVKQEGGVVIRLKYRYHAMGKKKQLIFRYDNVAHFPEIRTHPNHKHLPKKVVESSAPNLLEIIEEIEKLLIKQV